MLLLLQQPDKKYWVRRLRKIRFSSPVREFAEWLFLPLSRHLYIDGCNNFRQLWRTRLSGLENSRWYRMWMFPCFAVLLFFLRRVRPSGLHLPVCFARLAYRRHWNHPRSSGYRYSSCRLSMKYGSLLHWLPVSWERLFPRQDHFYPLRLNRDRFLLFLCFQRICFYCLLHRLGYSLLSSRYGICFRLSL